MEERYLIIADDFTGSNDTGVQLRRRGFPTEVLFCGKPMGADRSIVIDTELKGPETGENTGTESSSPYIVVKTELLDLPVVFR